MTVKNAFTQEDCIETGYAMSIAGKVVVLSRPPCRRSARTVRINCTLRRWQRQQPQPHWPFHLHGFPADGERARWNRGDVLGILSRALPDSARLHLSQIRPRGARPREHEPSTAGTAFAGRQIRLGRGSAAKGGEGLHRDAKEYQHRVMICNRDGFCVFEMVRGEVIHPLPETIEAFRKEQARGGMSMNL